MRREGKRRTNLSLLLLRTLSIPIDLELRFSSLFLFSKLEQGKREGKTGKDESVARRFEKARRRKELTASSISSSPKFLARALALKSLRVSATKLLREEAKGGSSARRVFSPPRTLQSREEES